MNESKRLNKHLYHTMFKRGAHKLSLTSSKYENKQNNENSALERIYETHTK